ncbi:GNAT family N-acetyltransferase [Bradyrhizobium sp.]|uniref:GNAT family N-acetyltransferase n=1 Tax=Bradyrhizobium sp. TaxID=376 RepID=UPI001D755046|nr:GNAT family N-acetyltransferase [Bradyrhizobium sp.]MBI5321212.1 GNAT family N-acetyltransferase [Bradyrhizobium sp.]
MTRNTELAIPHQVGEAFEISYGSEPAADFGPLARDRIPVRSMAVSDLAALVAIDRRITGHERRAYFERKLADALKGSDVRVSLVAELDGVPVGFIMARVDLGEFGRVDATAVLDTIGVDPDYRNRGVGHALISQLLMNLATLRVENVRTEVDWEDRELLAYLDSCGFRPSQQLCFDRSLN